MRFRAGADELALDLLTHHMLPAAGLIVDELPLQPDDIGEQPFGQTVLAHDVGGDPAPLCGELEVAVIADVEQTSRSILATVCDTVGPECSRRSAMRARNGTIDCSSSSMIDLRYISVVSMRSFTSDQPLHSSSSG